MKFDGVLDRRLSKEVETIRRIKKLTDICGRTLSKVVIKGDHSEDLFVETALQFNRISFESLDAVMLLLRDGYLSESFVLLRWYLEYGHLCFYLSQNREEYTKWLEGKQIKPTTIRDFIESRGMASWQSTYKDWCSVTHANSEFVENCSTISRMNPVDDDQVLLLGNALINLMFTSSKILYVIGHLLKPILDVSHYNKITKEYNQLNDIVLELAEEQNERERTWFKSKP